jgi:hypothetical protein
MKHEKRDREVAAKVEGPMSFGAWFNALANGEAEGNASGALHQLLGRMQDEAVAGRKKVKGKLKLEFSLTLDHTGVVGISYDVTTKEPPRLTTPDTYWVTDGGQLSRRNPNQKTLNFTEPNVPKPEVREPGAPAKKEV